MKSFTKGLIVGIITAVVMLAAVLAITPPVEQMIYEYLKDINAE